MRRLLLKVFGGGLLVLQLGCLWVALSPKGLAVPRFVERRMLSWVLGPQWELEHANPLYISLLGVFRMDQLRLLQAGEVCFEAQRLVLDLSWWGLLTRQRPVERIFLENGRANPWAHRLYLHAAIERSGLEIFFGSGRAQTGALAVLQGFFPWRFGQNKGEPQALLGDTVEGFLKSIGKIRGLYLKVQGFPGKQKLLAATALLQRGDLGPVSFSGPLLAQGVVDPKALGAKGQTFFLSTQAAIQVAGHQAAQGVVQLSLGDIRQPRTSWSLVYALRGLQVAGTSWPWWGGTLRTLSSETLGGELSLRDAHNKAVDGHWEIAPERIALSLQGNCDPVAWVKGPFEAAQYLRFNAGCSWTLDAQLGREGSVHKAEGSVEAQDLWAYGVPLRSAYLKGSWADNKLKVTHFDLVGSKSQATGCYEHCWGSHDFRFLLEGQVALMEIAPWMGNAWPRLFNPLKLHGVSVPRGSLDITGCWKDAEATTQLWGHVAADNLEYRGIYFKQVRGELALNPERITLKNGYLQRPEGSLQGSIDWTLSPPFDDLIACHFEVEGCFFPNMLASWSKAEFLSTFKKWHFSVAPKVHVCGDYDAQQEHPYSLEMDLDIPGSFSLNALSLDYAKAQVVLREGQVFMQAHELGFGGGFGSAQGHIDLRSEARTPYALALELQEITQRESLQAALGLNKGPTHELSSLGSLDVALNLNGDLKKHPLLSAEGSGSFELRNMDLEDVYFLGLLSHIMRILPLPFGRAQLNSAFGSFSLEPGLPLRFDNLIIQGPAAQVRATGIYDMDRDMLDMRLKFFLLGGVRAPIFSHLGKLFNPLSHMFEVFVTGPILEPRWSFKPEKGR